MADLKLGEAFGFDAPQVKKIDWGLALQRVQHDIRSDFIYAPHLAFIYAKAGEELTAQLQAQLKNGKFVPGMPLTIEVPKSNRMRVIGSKRLGPLFTRPGSILPPRDRVLYQVLANEAAPVIDQKGDKSRTFSHRLGDPNNPSMFLPTRACWNGLQKALLKMAADENVKYVVKLDVADFFGSLNQHTLINSLSDAGYKKTFASRLEAMLISYTGSRSSRGILQGLAPSDLLGNSYLDPIDRFLEEYDVPSARYVDDLYVFTETLAAADKLMRALIVELRNYDLVLNESKSRIVPKAALFTEEPDLEALFESAVEEVSDQLDEEDYDADYGFQSEWDEDEGDGNDEDDLLNLEATKILFDSIDAYPGHEEAIERFCLPLFSASMSGYAVDHVLDAFRKRPAMTQIYCSYLGNFVSSGAVTDKLEQLLEDEALLDWQTMWILAALLRKKPTAGNPVKTAWVIFKDANRHEALRAISAIYVGRFGDAARRKALVAAYPNVSSHVQTAIYYSSRNWPGVERANAKPMWGNQGELNTLLSIAMGK